MELTVQASIDHLAAVTAFVDEQLEGMDCPMRAQMQIDVAIDELFTNIAYYAYAPSTGEATIRVEKIDGGVTLTFIDSGVAYNPLEQKEPDVTLSAEERQVGGLGIFLVKKTMDDMTYRREDGKNILTIRKNFTK